MTSIYGILDTETNQFVSYGAKIAWNALRNAKNAYNYHRNYGDNKRFDEQTRYVIVDLTEAYFRLEGLEK
jgi:hypothetical protein